ncbi:hypothetical protein VNI00_004129 [Paramarasmius palmivorus]|uniref:Uncharacterized protein n=1 Tax=Paramarasmius palmivorus TaxID=297713 RepID=A0AAW0DPX1_9AGAR
MNPNMPSCSTVGYEPFPSSEGVRTRDVLVQSAMGQYCMTNNTGTTKAERLTNHSLPPLNMNLDEFCDPSPSEPRRGIWSSQEDALLVQAVQKFGYRSLHLVILPTRLRSLTKVPILFRWSLVSDMVKTRTNVQCARRWCDTLDPRIDKSPWTAEQDEQLLRAVERHGTKWSTLAKIYFPGRTGLALKNRYHTILRAKSPNKYKRASKSPTTEQPPNPNPGAFGTAEQYEQAYVPPLLAQQCGVAIAGGNDFPGQSMPTRPQWPSNPYGMDYTSMSVPSGGDIFQNPNQDSCNWMNSHYIHDFSRLESYPNTGSL